MLAPTRNFCRYHMPSRVSCRSMRERGTEGMRIPALRFRWRAASGNRNPADRSPTPTPDGCSSEILRENPSMYSRQLRDLSDHTRTNPNGTGAPNELKSAQCRPTISILQKDKGRRISRVIGLADVSPTASAISPRILHRMLPQNARVSNQLGTDLRVGRNLLSNSRCTIRSILCKYPPPRDNLITAVFARMWHIWATRHACIKSCPPPAIMSFAS